MTLNFKNLENLKNWQELKSWRPYFIFFILGFLLYGQSLFFNFTYLDDQALILDNAPILSDIKNVGKIFADDVFFSQPKFYYRPLLNISLMFDFSVAGTLPVIFHLTNIILHLIAVSLIFLLFCRLNYRKILAFWLALFFLFQPVLAQAVVWIPGRNDSLLTIFVLAAFLSFLAFRQYASLKNYIAYFFFLLAALLTKENAVFLPFLVIFFSFFIERQKILARDKWLLILTSAVAMFIWFLMRSFALSGSTLTLSTAFSSIYKNSPALLVFLGKAIFPFDLVVLPVLADAKLIYGLIAVPLIILALFFSRQKRGAYIIFGLAWFLLFILPSFIQPNLSEIPDFLEHRLYLPLIGLLIILAEIDWFKNLDFKKKIVKIILPIILIIFSFLIVRHSLNFKDHLSFWEAAVKSSPHSPLAQRNLGVMYYFAGQNDLAAKHYRLSLNINPQESMAHNNLGIVYLNEQKYSQAEKEFKKELTLNPNYDKALFNLGDVYYRTKRFKEAADYWQATLRVNPAYGEAYERLNILENQLR